MTPVNSETHRFAMTGFGMPDADGIMKATGRCMDCGTPMAHTTDLVVPVGQTYPTTVLFAESEYCAA